MKYFIIAREKAGSFAYWHEHLKESEIGGWRPGWKDASIHNAPIAALITPASSKSASYRDICTSSSLSS